MVLLDVNVLVYAHRQDSPHHRQYLSWLENLVNSDHPYGLSDLVLSGFLRVVTHPKVFNPPSSMDKALLFIHELREQPQLHRHQSRPTPLGHLLPALHNRRPSRQSCTGCIPRRPSP